jgi:hypothetical protein
VVLVVVLVELVVVVGPGVSVMMTGTHSQIHCRPRHEAP